MNNNKKLYNTGSLSGLIISVGIGVLFYFVLSRINVVSNLLDYNTVISNADDNLQYKLIWFIMNFTEPEFYAGFFASIGLILGGILAWRLDVKNSKFAGFNICYDKKLFPWVLASQLLSLFLAVFVFNFTRFFNSGEYTWLPTFISVVAAPPAIILIYGPSIATLLTASLLGGIMSFPVAFWLMNNILPVLGVPGTVASLLAMTVTGILIAGICKTLPWIKKLPLDGGVRTQEQPLEEMVKPLWFVRRVFADFTEPQFYGNEIAGLFLIIGVCLDWVLNVNHVAYASGAIPAILLSQFIASSVGIFLYFNKYVERGWYATFVPVVSVGPACVLMFGSSIGVAVTAGVLGAIIGAPLAEYFCDALPDDYHPTIGNVTSMAVTTIVVSMIIKVLPWF